MPTSLSDNQIQVIATAIESGRAPRVYFTEAAAGMVEGRSGKVVAVADLSEPDSLRVRPAGLNDTLAFSPSELTLTKPSRRRSGNPPRGEANLPFDDFGDDGAQSRDLPR
ncbi:hypothetical protein [Nocardia sp. XZ_19_385]|uniref:hypothetical protein n=1 Tax=Nocardia sp. XZ_19_385 TaxID=2769488 RepID=UPI00188F28FC|nr:hypothetical protein [Nocardia sp. XZ_19_385]